MAKQHFGVAPSLVVNKDGTVSVKTGLTDQNGAPMTTLTVWPTQVAIPGVKFSDAANPSAFVYTPAAAITPDPANPGEFILGSIACVQPVVQPPAQNVDVTMTIDSGLTNQTAPISEDAGTLSIAVDASQPSGFAPVLSEP